jgi:hypothetical protein
LESGVKDLADKIDAYEEVRWAGGWRGGGVATEDEDLRGGGGFKRGRGGAVIKDVLFIATGGR